MPYSMAGQPKPGVKGPSPRSISMNDHHNGVSNQAVKLNQTTYGGGMGAAKH